jgi:putative endonuclease
MCDYLCYMIASLDSNKTYIGSTNNFPKRFEKHNSGTGAKSTRGQTWVPIITVAGFQTKNACLSFEAQWKRLSKKRTNSRFILMNMMGPSINLFYDSDTKWNRIMDLIYFMHNFTLVGDKFKLDCGTNLPNQLTISIFSGEFIGDLPWPHFVKIIHR